MQEVADRLERRLEPEHPRAREEPVVADRVLVRLGRARGLHGRVELAVLVTTAARPREDARDLLHEAQRAVFSTSPVTGFVAVASSASASSR